MRVPRLVVLAGLPLVATVAVARPQAHGPFDAPLVVATELQRITDVADRDGDGWADAYGWWEHSLDRIEVQGWRNDQRGNLVLDFALPPIDVGGYADAGESAVGDFDADGRDDYVLSAGRTVLIFRSNGLGAPTLLQRIDGLQVPSRSVQLADFTGDGRLDLAFLSYFSPRIYRYDPGTDQFVLASSASGDLQEFVVADVTGDGQPDLVGPTKHGDYRFGVLVVPVVGGVLQSPQVYPFLFSDQDAAVAAVGDVDGDGDLDVLLFGMGTQTGPYPYGPRPPRVAVLRCGPGHALTPEPLYAGGPARRLVDVDADGDLDAVCCGGGTYYRPRNWMPSTYRVAINDGAGRFAPSLELPGLGSSRIAGATDLDHDGDVDLVAGRTAYYARGPLAASFAPVLARPAESIAVVPGNDRLTDVDGDGDPDFHVWSRSYVRNLGDGTSVSAARAWPALPAGVAIDAYADALPGDFDGDGEVDSLVYAGVSGSGRMRLLRGVGGGAVVDGGDAGPSFPGNRWTTFDVEGDGDLDVYVPQYTATTTWLNDGAGHFSAGPTQTPGEDAVAYVDLDGDAILDMVAATYTQPVWRPGLGAGAFAPVRTFGPVAIVELQARAVTAGDLDADGDVDVAALLRVQTNGAYPGGLHVYWNDGVGNFTDQLLDPIGSSEAALASFDVDGDGRLDLVSTVAITSGILSVYCRRSDNAGFDAPVEQSIGLGVLSAVVDADGDGDLDVATNRVYRNRRFLPPASGVRRQLVDGVAGTGGIVPVMGGAGSFRVGESVEVRLRGARPGTSGRFYGAWIAQAPPPFGGGPSIPAARQRFTSILPITTSGIAGDPATSGRWTLPYVVPAYKAGRTYAYFAELDDDTAPSGSARSNTLRITYGP